LLNFIGDVWLSGQNELNTSIIPDGLVVLNLEAPLAGGLEGDRKKICLKSHAESVRNLLSDRECIIGLSNNHIFDFGSEGFKNTIQFLNESGTPFFGAGAESDNYNNPLILSCGIAIGGYVCASTHPATGGGGYGVAMLTLERVLRDRKLAFEGGASSFVAVIHWGEEEVTIPKLDDVRLARSLVLNGVDLIIGHHAHVIQSHETFFESSIFYGLGNACFDDFDIEVPEGKTVMAWAKQRWWNRRSLIVNVDSNASVQSIWKGDLSSSGGYLAEVRLRRHELSEVRNGKMYRYYFELVRRLCFLRLGVSRFLHRPKVPSLNSILHLIGMRP